MKLLIVHLSDIHLKAEGNSVLKKKEHISKAFQNETLGIDNLFMVISGDIAFSGKDTEYNQAIELIDSIKSNLESYSQKKVNCVMIPGNHDCDYENKNKEGRETLIINIQENGDQAIDEGVIDQCCEVQSNFLKFLGLYQDNNNILYSDNLLSIIEYKFDRFNIIFNCYNTSWISQKDEEPGTMHFPVKRYPRDYINHKSNLIISILHHPFNWQDPVNSRELRTHIEETTDIVLTGHEHVASKSIKYNLDGNYTEYIEGAVLQESDYDENSGFNVILIDLENENQKLLQYKWDGEIYSLANETSEWFSYKRYKSIHKRVFEINNKFEEYLNDPGASFTHPHKSKLVLEDFFVYPSLRDLNIDKTKYILNDVLNSNILCQINEPENKILLIGAGKSGKSSLCMILYKHYYNNSNYIPIYIDGQKIKSASIEDFNKLMNHYFKKQYSDDTLEKFQQLENRKKILIIDDFHKSKLNIKYRSLLLNRINKCYPNIIITGNDLFQFEEIVYEKEQQEIVLEGYQKFEIIEFGHLLRSKLINKWSTIGQEEYIHQNELIRKNDNAKQIVDTIIGKNFVPSYPIFLLIILQTIEAGYPHNLKESLYGYYYQVLIIQALSKINKRTDEIDAYYNYITELANYLFENKTPEISKDNLIEFHKWYCEEYKISPDFNEIISNLIDAFIIEQNDDIYRFRYKYIYYFFLAKYISNNITREDIKQRISKMCKRLHIEEFANVIMFLTHHSKDPIILEEIIANAKSLFPEFQPVKFENDISAINNLMDEIPILVLENRDVKENREEKLKIQDQVELHEKQNSNGNNKEDFDLEGGIIELDIIAKLNLAFKTIEILGQVLKNYYGSLKGTTKLALGEEAYFIGLRSLNSFFSILGENTDYFVNEIKSFIEKNKLVERDKIEEVSKRLVFKLSYLVSYSFIKKVSGFIGTQKLSETFKEILKKNDITSVHMIDISIKLDFFKGFPYDDIKKLAKKLSRNVLPHTLLRHLVINYLYMFPTKHRDKQSICDILGIPIDTQRIIDSTSTQKKRK